MRTLSEIMADQMQLRCPVACLDSGFDDLMPEESLFYAEPMSEEEMEGW